MEFKEGEPRMSLRLSGLPGVQFSRTIGSKTEKGHGMEGGPCRESHMNNIQPFCTRNFWNQWLLHVGR